MGSSDGARGGSGPADPERTVVDEAAGAAAVAVLTEALGYAYAAALRAAALVGVADHFGGRPRTPAELAAATGTDAGVLLRVLRLLATRGIFREDDQGRFEMTDLSEPLRTDAPFSVRNAVVMVAMRTHWYGTFELPSMLRDGQRGFDRAFGMPFFDYLAAEDEARAEFFGGMASFSDVTLGLAVTAYDFPASGTVVDVGGGHGGFLRRILSRNPGLNGVLFDREHVLADHCLAELGADDRWRLAAGDFFEAVPTGGDVYVMTYILHDWTDEECVRILRNCREAMNPDGRIVAFDGVIPVGNEPDHNKVLDVVMSVMLPGRERTEAELRTVFTQAGLRVERVSPTPGPLSVIEAVRA